MRSPLTFPIYAFNFNDQIDLQAIVAALNRAEMPGILMLSAKAIEFSGLIYLAKMFEAAKIESQVELYLELDHCSDLTLIEKYMGIGFDVIMADFSHADFQTNVALTRKAVEMGAARGILVEGELGVVPTLEAMTHEPQHYFTDPGLVLEFVEQTQVDLLAVSVGNLHGTAHPKPLPDFELIRLIAERLAIPIVLHGSDFMTNDTLLRAFRAGISKANLGPELRIAYVKAIQEGMAALKDHTDHRPILQHARKSIERDVLNRLSVLKTLRGDSQGGTKPTG